MATVAGFWKCLELRSGSDGKNFYIKLESKESTLKEIAKLGSIDVEKAKINYCYSLSVKANQQTNQQTVTENPVAGWLFQIVRDYGRLSHLEPIPGCDDFNYYSRVYVADLLLADGWKQLGFSTHPVRNTSELVETWIKFEQQ